MDYTIRTTSVYFICGISYAFFWWGLFALYCIAHQLNRIRVYYIRKQRIAGNDDKVVTDLPGHRLLAYFNFVVCIPFVTKMIPVKHVIGVSVFVIINLLFIFFAPFKMQDGFGYILPPISIFDRRAAFVGMVNWGFVFFLAQRNSILVRMSGLTFEELIPFHRIIARIGLLEFFPHFVWRIWQGYEDNHVVKDALFEDAEQSSGTMAMLGFLLMFASSFEYIRRNHFEVFYYSHIIFMLMGIMSACYHENSCFAFFIPAIILWFVDRIIRSYQSWIVKTTSVRVDQVVSYSGTQEGVVRILFENTGLNKFKPGQYVFVSIARNGRKLWEYANWHPFTISEVFRVGSSTNADGSTEERIVESTAASSVTNVNIDDKKKQPASLASSTDPLSDISSLRHRATALPADIESRVIGTLHVKALGDKTRGLLRSAAANEEIKVSVDGPYGPDLKYQDYQVAALFATGIGITPALAIIKDIVERRSSGVRTMAIEHIYLSWAVRTTAEIAPFKDMFMYWNEKIKSCVQPIHLTATFFVTRMNEGPSVLTDLSGFTFVYGKRPKINIEMDKVKTVYATRRVWVHACGDATFTRTVINEAIRHKFDAHNETFEF